MLGKGKERFIEVEIKKRKKVNNQRSKICFVHTILSRIVDSPKPSIREVASVLWLLISNIPGKENILADAESRKTRRETEWTLDRQIFQKAMRKIQFVPQIDLFASRLNYQLKPLLHISLIQRQRLLMHLQCLGNLAYFMPFLLLV